MNPLTFSIPLNNQALCPICRIELLGQVVHVYGSIVFCRRCIATTHYHILNRVIRRCHNPRYAEVFTTSCGLIILTPKRFIKPSMLRELFNYQEKDSYHGYPQFIGVLPESCFADKMLANDSDKAGPLSADLPIN